MLDIHARRVQAAYEHYVDLMEEQRWTYEHARSTLNHTHNQFERAGLKQAIISLYPHELSH